MTVLSTPGAGRSAAAAISAWVQAQALDGRRPLVLDAGRGPARWRTITPALIDGPASDLVFLERNRSRLEAATRELPGRARLIEAELDQIGLTDRFDVLYFDLVPRGIAGFLTKTAYNIASLAAVGALVLLNVPVAASGDAEAADVEAFERFLMTECDDARPDVEHLVGLFSKCLPFSVVAVADAANAPVRGFAFKTLIFRKCDARSETFSCTLKTAEQKNFRLDDVAAVLEDLRSRNTFVSTRSYVERLLHPDAGRSEKSHHHLRHDIHHDLQTALRMARVEREISLPASFFIMHSHGLSERYVELPETIEVLLEIQSLGHEIGIHVDVLDLTVKGPGLVPGLRGFVERLRAAGLRLNLANTHGNTGYALTGLRPQNVFVEYPLPGDPPGATPDVTRVLGSQSLAAVARELGIPTWFDSFVYSHGTLAPSSKFQVTDNYRTLSVWRAGARLDEVAEMVFQTPLWQASSSFVRELADIVGDHTCTYLLHPQFYK
jgi:hypothetical protein